MIKQMQFSDAKAGAIIALMGFLSLRGPIKIEEISQTGIFEHLFFTASGIAVICCLLAIFPRFPSKSARQQLYNLERWSWPALSGGENNPQEYSEYVRTAEVSELLHSLSISNFSIANILLAKYQMLRIGFIFGLCSVGFIGLKILEVF